MIPRLSGSTLFPYTTLFRSAEQRVPNGSSQLNRRIANLCSRRAHRSAASAVPLHHSGRSEWTTGCSPCPRPIPLSNRSEEHTSELQSHVNLVCRLLLEKKKK